MAQFVVQLGSLVQDERAYLAEVARGRPARVPLESWQAACMRLAGQRLMELEVVPEARPTATALKTALGAYVGEFIALRTRIDNEGIARVDVSGADVKALHDAFDGLDRQASEQLARYRGQMDAGATAVRKDVNVSYVGVGAMLVAGLLLVVMTLRFFVYAPVLAEADALTQVCNAVSIGDLSSRVPDPSDTELGSVARSLNTMLDNTVTLVQSRTERDQMQAAVMKLLDEVGGVAEERSHAPGRGDRRRDRRGCGLVSTFT